MPAQKRSLLNSDEDPPRNDAVNHDEREEEDEEEEVDNGDEVEDGDDDDDGEDDDGDDDEGEEEDEEEGDDDEEDEEEEEEEEEDENEEGADRSASGDINVDNEEFILVRTADIRKEVQCPICLGIIRKTRTVMECLHRFCRECIDKSMRMGNNECPACRTHCASRRSLRDDPNYDALINAIYPNIDLYEEEELAFQDDEKARNKQIQAQIAQTYRRQTEALTKKRKRSHGNLRRRRNYQTEDDDDANGHDGGKESSSADERCAEPKPKRPKRWRGQPSPAAASGEGANDENEQEVQKEAGVSPAAFVGTSDMLVWGGGGMRSNTRHGSGSAGNGKYSRSRLARLNEHLRNSDMNDKELDIQVMLVSLDEQKEPLLRHSYLCGRPALSVGQLCQFIALQTSLPPENVEILGVKGIRSRLSSLSTMQVQTSSSSSFEECKDELQVLDAKETIAGLKAATNFSRGHLTLAYRRKSM